MLNLWIGLCMGDPALPDDIKTLGYEIQWIESEFSNQDYKTVRPELIIASRQLSHTLILEFKSGANLKPDQLHRYSRIVKKDLVEKALIDIDMADLFDVVIIGQGENAERLKIGLDEKSYSFPLLITEANLLKLIYNKFTNSSLNQLFLNEFKINFDLVPSQYIPLDQDSELDEVAELIIPVLFKYMSTQTPAPRVSVDTICHHICPVWDCMGTPFRNIFKLKVKQVLEKAANTFFKEYLNWLSVRGGSVEIKNNPFDQSPTKRTRAFQMLLGIQKNFIKNLREESAQLELPFFP